MTKLLLRLFVKDYKNPTESTRASVGAMAGAVGIVCNLLLFAAKLAVGIAVGSVAVFADSANNFSDSAASVITLFGFRMARRPADKDHPFGHARYEYLSGLAIAVFVLVLGVELGTSSVKKIINPVETEFSTVAFLVLFLAAGLKLWMFFFFRGLGKRINSDTLKATATDSRNDVLVTLAVLAGGCIQRFFEVNADGYIGLAVCLFILYSGVRLVGDTISSLLGKQASNELIENIGNLVLSHQDVIGIHDLLVHDYGPDKCYASLHAELSCEIDALTCHDIIDRIERDAFEKLNVHMVIHPDPVTVNDKEWQEMRAVVEKLVKEIDANLAIHDFRVVKSDYLPRLVFDMDVPYSMHRRNDELQKEIDASLANMGKNYITVIKFDGK